MKKILSTVIASTLALAAMAQEQQYALPFADYFKSSEAFQTGGISAVGVNTDNYLSNPAAVAYMPSHVAARFSMSAFPDGSLNEQFDPQSSFVLNAGLAAHFGPVAVVASYASMNGPESEKINDYGGVVGIITPKYSSINAGAAFKVADLLSVGVTVNLLKNDWKESSLSGTGLGFDIQSHAVKNTILAAGVKNFGKVGDFSLPGYAYIAAAEELELGPMSLAVLTEERMYLAGGYSAALALELAPIKHLAVKAAFNLCSNIPMKSNISAGVTAKLGPVALNGGYTLLIDGYKMGLVSFGAGLSF